MTELSGPILNHSGIRPVKRMLIPSGDYDDIDEKRTKMEVDEEFQTKDNVEEYVPEGLLNLDDSGSEYVPTPIKEAKEPDYPDTDQTTLSTDSEGTDYFIEVIYPPFNMYVVEPSGGTVHVNRHKRGACFLSNLPKELTDHDLQSIFSEYHLDRIAPVQDAIGQPTGNVYIFGPWAFIQMIVAWAPNVFISRNQIIARYVGSAELAVVFGKGAMSAIYPKTTPGPNTTKK